MPAARIGRGRMSERWSSARNGNDPAEALQTQQRQSYLRGEQPSDTTSRYKHSTQPLSYQNLGENESEISEITNELRKIIGQALRPILADLEDRPFLKFATVLTRKWCRTMANSRTGAARAPASRTSSAFLPCTCLSKAVDAVQKQHGQESKRRNQKQNCEEQVCRRSPCTAR